MRVIFTITLAAICGNIYTTAFCQEKPGPQLYFTTRENSRVQANTAYYYQCTAFDSADHALTYTAENLPAWLTFNTGTHTLTGKTQSAGQYPVTLAVSNGAATARQHFMLTVGDENTANILCLGNSITNGTSKFNSYRRLLWQMLHKSNYNFDMVGSWSKHHAGGEVPNPDFDMDHDGHSGWTTGHVFHPPGWDSTRGNLQQWLTGYTPDIVLIELGTNDVFQCVATNDIINNLIQIVDTLRNHNNKIKIFLAQIPPLGQQWALKKLCGDSITYNARIKTLNKAIFALSQKMNSKQSLVIAVDQYTGVNPATDMYDDIHPNTKGEEEMAKRWFEKIKNFIPTLPNFAP